MNAQHEETSLKETAGFLGILSLVSWAVLALLGALWPAPSDFRAEGMRFAMFAAVAATLFTIVCLLASVLATVVDRLLPSLLSRPMRVLLFVPIRLFTSILLVATALTILGSMPILLVATALIIFGVRKLPTVMHALGQGVKKRRPAHTEQEEDVTGTLMTLPATHSFSFGYLSHLDLVGDRQLVLAVPVPPLVTLALLVVACLVWNFACMLGLGQLLNEQSGDTPSLYLVFFTPSLYLVFFSLIGAAVSLYTLDALFVRRSWVVRRGQIVRRTRVPLLGFTWDWRYGDVERIEFRHGVWNTGRGYTDLLRFRVRGRRTPIALGGTEYVPTSISWTGQPVQATEEILAATQGQSLLRSYQIGREIAHQKLLREEAEEEEWLSALGQSFAAQVGAPFTVVEEEIPEPSSD